MGFNGEKILKSFYIVFFIKVFPVVELKTGSITKGQLIDFY